MQNLNLSLKKLPSLYAKETKTDKNSKLSFKNITTSPFRRIDQYLMLIFAFNECFQKKPIQHFTKDITRTSLFSFEKEKIAGPL